MVKSIKRRVARAELEELDPGQGPEQGQQEQAEDRPVTLEDLSFLSASARRALAALAEGFTQRESADEELERSLTEDALELLKRDLEGQRVEHLELSLDWLRELGLYQLSLELLEESWSAELPLDLLGRVAQDWIGTALFGLSDEEGAREVARHITPRALELGASFCGDLCDVLLEWGLHEEATPLAEHVAQAQPGDSSARFHLGVCAKLSGRWELARQSFAEVKRLHPKDPATLWNVGLVAVAERRWPEAREAWGALGFGLPEGEGDYATPGELSPIRLSCRARAAGEESLSARAQTAMSTAPRVSSEVLWGVRLCPARVQLTAIPYHHPSYRCGDVLLIDGVKAGEVEHQGQRFPISPVIGRFEESAGETIDLVGPARSAEQERLLAEAVQALSEAGWTLALWTRRFPRRLNEQGALLTQLSLYLAPGQEASAFKEALLSRGLYAEASAGGLQSRAQSAALYNARWAELVAEDVGLHERLRAALLS